MADFIDLIKSYGPSLAGWVLLITFFGWMAGRGGVLAMRNVKTLLDTGEELRAKMKDSLDDCEKQIERRDEQIRQLSADIETARVTMRRMNVEIHEMEDRVHKLTRELEDARAMRRTGDFPHGP